MKEIEGDCGSCDSPGQEPPDTPSLLSICSPLPKNLSSVFIENSSTTLQEKISYLYEDQSFSSKNPFLTILVNFFQSLKVSLRVTAHGTRECIPCGKMETQDSGTVGLVRFFLCFAVCKTKQKRPSKLPLPTNSKRFNRTSSSFPGGQVTFDLKNDGPTLTGAKATFNINLNFPPNQTALSDGQVVWAQNCTINGKLTIAVVSRLLCGQLLALKTEV